MADVIPIKDANFRLLPKKKGHGCGCRCSRVFVVEHTRMLECRECSAVIDPFDFLFKEAQRQSSIHSGLKQKLDESDRLREEIAELKRVKRNLQAQKNRLQKSLPL